MPIAQSDIQLRLSGGAGNNDPAASLGGVKSANLAGSGLFDTVSGTESAAGDLEYRCVYLHNADSSRALQNTVFSISANTPSPTTAISVGLDPVGLNGTAQTIPNESVPPTGVAFTLESLNLGNIPAGQHYPIWIQRAVGADTAAIEADTYSFNVTGEST